jgi:HK97 family phage portal protein
VGIRDWFTSKKPNIEERAMISYGSNNLSHLSGTIYSMFTTSSDVTEEQAMKIPSVVACVELITGSIAQLPIYLYKQNEKNEVERVPNDKRVFLLNNEPNSLINAYNFKKKLAKDFLLYGVSYTKKEMIRNNVEALNTFPMTNVYVTKYLIDGYKYDADIRLTYVGSNKEKMERIFKPDELVIVVKDTEDGVTGKGVLTAGAETLTLALNEVEYTSNILKNGALPIGVIETMNKLSENAIKRLRSGWESLYGGSKNAGKTVILEEGLQYKPISIKPNDMQLVESKKITISEIARLFNVPESMLNADANKYASNEQNNLHFLQYTLAPIISAIESALDKSLLLENEKEDGYYFRFDVSEILRTTEKEKIESAATGLTKGLYSLNETRAKLDMHKLEDDYFIWSLGNVLYNPKTGEIIVPNMQGSGDLDNPTPTQSVDKLKQKPTKVPK